MELVSHCLLPAAQLFWQAAPSRWALTLVCKATFRLEPGTAPLAAEQERILSHEAHRDDDPDRSLIAPSDLVPFKSLVDVVLVGNAYSRDAQPVQSLVVRMNVGKVDKSIEVLASRTRSRDGEVREGRRWTKMALLYERAAGGPGTDNPVGVWPGGPADSQGEVRWPNLQPPGFPIGGGQLPPPIGFGPIAASWPLRQSSNRGASPHHDRVHAPFGAGFDPAFFQVAPPDQRLDELRPNERITLENLHPKHARLVTRLPGLVPHARVERERKGAREIGMLADTVWIDTRRAIFTVAFRGHIEVEHPDEEGVITLTTRTVTGSVAPALEKTASLPPVTTVRTAANAAFSAGPALPFQPAAPPVGLPSPTPEPPLATLPSSPPPAPVATPAIAPPPLLSSPAWGAALATAPLLLAPPPGDGSFGAAEASNAAVRGREAPREYMESGSPPGPGPRAEPEAPAEQTPKLHSLVAAAPVMELVWADAVAPERIKAHPGFAAWARSTSGDGARGAAQSPPRELVRDLLARGPVSTANALDAALEVAEAESPPGPALVLLTGMLELGLDEIELLRAITFAAAPLAGSDRRLKEGVDLATEVLRAPMPGMPDFLEGLGARIRDAWARANPLLSPDHLITSAERMLLEQRRYQKRELWGEVLFRALLGGAGWETPIPVYVPAASVKSLPLYRRFPARVLGEVVWQQDAQETHPLALRALALGRLPARAPGRRTRRGPAPAVH